MAKVSFNSAVSSPRNEQTGDRIGFFSLKNDNDEAIVRFMHNTPDDFDIVDVHPYLVDGRYRNINCLSTPSSSVDSCPLCSAEGVKRTRKIYVHLIQYTTDDQGNIVATPRIWERPFRFAEYLASLCGEYGPLSDLVFKVKRHGAPGDMQTTYDVLYANPAVYKPELYIKKEEAFANYNPIGSAVLSYTKEQMNKLIHLYDAPESNNTPAVPTSAPAAETFTPTVPQVTPRTYTPDATAVRSPAVTDNYANTNSVTPRRLPF